MSEAPGRVILAAAPLGDVRDASARLSAALAAAPVIAAEDTRRVRRLCADLGVTPSGRVTSFFDANESARLPSLLAALRGGEDVLVVTDAGMPSVSDPGYRLVVAAIAEGIDVTVLPGPSAVTAALAVSGLPVDRFCFEGFLPARPRERRAALEALAHERRTLVFFEAPHRIAAALTDMAAMLGPERAAVVARELTKAHETIYRGTLRELAARATTEANFARGEITLVVRGAAAAAAGVDERVLRRTIEVLSKELPPGRVAAVAAQLTGATRAAAYALATHGTAGGATGAPLPDEAEAP